MTKEQEGLKGRRVLHNLMLLHILRHSMQCLGDLASNLASHLEFMFRAVMSLQAQCPSCQATYRINEEFAGKKLRCKKCSAVIKIPQVAPEEEEWVAPPIRKKKPKSRGVIDKRKSSQDGMPFLIIVAIICLSMMAAFNVLQLFGVVLILKTTMIPIRILLPQILVGIAKLGIEAVVIIGLTQRHPHVRVPSIVMSVLTCLWLGYTGFNGIAIVGDAKTAFFLFLGFDFALRVVHICCLANSKEYFD